MAQILGKKSIAILVSGTCITSSIDNHQRSTDGAHRSILSTDIAHRSILSTDIAHRSILSTDIAHRLILSTDIAHRSILSTDDAYRLILLITRLYTWIDQAVIISSHTPCSAFKSSKFIHL